MIFVSRCFPVINSCQCIRRIPTTQDRRIIGGVFQHLRLGSTTAKVAGKENEPERGKRKRRVKVKDSEEPPEYLLNHFKTADQLKILSSFPPSYFHKKQNSPSNFYLADKSVANIIARSIPANDDAPILEINPGPGLLTRKLVKTCKQNVHLFEADANFTRNLDEIVQSSKGRVSLKTEDFTAVWKLTYRDKLDGGNRMQMLLGDKMPKKEWNEGPNARIVGATGSYNFFKHLIHSIVTQGSLFSFGRCEMFLIVPPLIYVQLTCTKEAGYFLYRYMTVLFQMFFEYEFIEKVPRKAFLPWAHAYNHKQHSKLSKIHSIDEDYFYLVRILPRREVYDLCAADDMQALLFFVKQNMFSRANRVIPMLEKWIPYCGLRLIAQKDTPKHCHSGGENPKTNVELPQFVQPCQSISNTDHHRDYNIFTQFGDLTPSQMLSLFHQFRHWPEYSQSPFLTLMENNLWKTFTTHEDASAEAQLGFEDKQAAADDEIKTAQ